MCITKEVDMCWALLFEMYARGHLLAIYILNASLNSSLLSKFSVNIFYSNKRERERELYRLFVHQSTFDEGRILTVRRSCEQGETQVISGSRSVRYSSYLSRGDWKGEQLFSSLFPSKDDCAEVSVYIYICIRGISVFFERIISEREREKKIVIYLSFRSERAVPRAPSIFPSLTIA